MIRSMRIGVWSYSVLPKVDGVTYRVKNIVRELHARGHSIFMITANANAVAYEGVLALLKLPGFAVPGYPGAVVSDAKRWGLIADLLRGFLLRHQVDVMWTTMPEPGSFILHQILQQVSVPWVASHHIDFVAYVDSLRGAPYEWTPFRMLVRGGVDRMLALPDRMLVPSSIVAQTLSRESDVMPIAVDASIFSPSGLRRPHASSAGLPVLYAGRLSDEKSVADLLNAPRKYPLRLAGDGPQRISLERLFEGRSATFLGMLSQRELAVEYRSAWVVVNPSATETLGFSTVEAQACGCCVVARAAGGTLDVIRDGVDGLLYRTNEDLVRILNDLEANPHIRESIAASATLITERRSWGGAGSHMEATLRSVINRHKVAGAEPTKLHALANAVWHRAIYWAAWLALWIGYAFCLV